MEGEGAALTETDSLEAMPSASQPLLTQESLVAVLPTSIPKASRHVLAQVLDVLDDVHLSKNFRKDNFERVKNERDRLLTQMNAYKVEKKKHERMLVET